MQFEGKCPQKGCQADIKPADTEAQFKRNLGLHLRTQHGIPGRGGYIPVRLQPGHPKYIGDAKAKTIVSPEKLRQLELARQAKREERERSRQRKEEGKAKALPLDRCPACGAEFLLRLNGKIKSLKTVECKPCGIQFYYTGKTVEAFGTS